VLTVEHRAAPSLPIHLELAQCGESLALQLRGEPPSIPTIPAETSLDECIISILSHSDCPAPASELRALCSVRKATFYERLHDLTREGRLVPSPEGCDLTTAI